MYDFGTLIGNVMINLVVGGGEEMIFCQATNIGNNLDCSANH